MTSGLSVNFARPNRSKNLKEKPDRSSDRNFAPKLHVSDPNASYQTMDRNPKKNVKSNKDTPSTVTSSNSQSTTQPCSSNSMENVSAVEPSNVSSRDPEQHSAEQVTKKLIHQLTSMNKYNLKQMINNPSSKYETALQTHARKRMRAEMRTKLQSMSVSQESQLLNNVLDTEESVDMDKIPDNVFDEIGRVLDINLLGQEDDNTNKKYNDDSDDKDKEQIAYPEDLFLRAEKLLMENSILFLEDRINDSMLNGDRLEEDRTPMKIKNEIKEEPDDITDDNFFEIQESTSDAFLLNDLVFEDREGTIPIRNDNFVEELNKMADTERATENCLVVDGNNGELVQTVKEEISESDLCEQTTNNNVEDDTIPHTLSKNSIEPSPRLYKTPDKQRSTTRQLSPPSTNSHKTTTSDDFKALLTNVKQEFNRESESSKSTTIQKINPFASNFQEQTQQQLTPPPKKNDLFTKLQNSGAFETTSTKRRTDAKLETTDYKRDNPYTRKKKKKHKSRSRSRLRSRSRSSSRSRNSHRSKKSSRDRSRRRDTSQYSNVFSDTVDSRNKIAASELYNDLSTHAFDQHDESSSKLLVQCDEPAVENNEDKTDPSVQTIQVVCINDLATEKNTTETQPDVGHPDFREIIAATESISDNQDESPIHILGAQHIETTPMLKPSDDLTDFNKEIDFKLDDQTQSAQSVPTSDAENVTTTNIQCCADDATEEIVQRVIEKAAITITDTFAESVEEAVLKEGTEKVNGATSETLSETDTRISEKTVKETVQDIVKETLSHTSHDKVEETVSKSVEYIPITNSEPKKVSKQVGDSVSNGHMLQDVSSAAPETIGDESTGSNSIENSMMNSKSQSSVPDDAESGQKNNIAAIKKMVLKPSSSGHQKSSSKHKCEKERHAASSHKVKKPGSTSSQKSKKADHKGENSVELNRHLSYRFNNYQFGNQCFRYCLLLFCLFSRFQN